MALTRIRDNRQYHVVPGEPPLLGYTFCNDNGDRLGDVVDLIADTDARQVKYLIVALDPAWLLSRRIIVPWRACRLDADAERVVCLTCSPEQLQRYPADEGGDLLELPRRFAATFLPAGGPESQPPRTGPAERQVPGSSDVSKAPADAGGHKHEAGGCGMTEILDEGGVIFERRRDEPPRG